MSSGGGSGHTHTSEYALSAKTITLTASMPMPPAVPTGPYVITLSAVGMMTDGIVDIGATKGVRVTAGPPSLPPTHDDSVNGVAVQVGPIGTIDLLCGMVPGVDPEINMAPAGITVDAGLGTVLINSMTSITLQVAGGAASIAITPEGVTITGILVQIA